MRTSSIFAAGALVALTAAVPMQLQQRDIVWVTHTDVDIVTDAITTTIWVTAGAEAEPTATAHHVHHHHKHPMSPVTSHITSTLTVHPSSPTTASATTAVQTPATISTPEAAPTTTTPAAPVAPTTTQQQQQPSTTTPTSAPTTTASTGSSGGAVTTGEITYYTPGLGSCGITSSESELVVAMPVGIMQAAAGGDANPNTNPLCGQSITLTSGSTSVTAKIVDTCPTCDDQHIDSSPAVFSQFGALALGVIQGISWTVPS